jgi:Zn-dependent protease
VTELSIIEKVFIWAIPVVFAITVHEVAHGWVANQLGDPTAKIRGRLSLNPIKHVDPVGTVILPLILLYLGGFVFGWAKPVPVDWRNLGHPRRDMALVAAAGPLANLIMMCLWAVLAKVLLFFGQPLWIIHIILIMCSVGIIMNIVLMVLNLFPVLPLDGGRIITAMLPVKAAQFYSRLEPAGLLILVILLFTGVLGNILTPSVAAIEGFVHEWIN